MPAKKESTLCILKPDLIASPQAGLALKELYQHDFDIEYIFRGRVLPPIWEAFYHEHEGKPFFKGLVDFMSSDTIMVLKMTKINAVKDLRKLIGATDPKKAKKGTFRKTYGTTMPKNAIHASDSVESAERELKFWKNL
jgi:nucleoside-diphosphate kinase